jgi:transposase
VGGDLPDRRQARHRQRGDAAKWVRQAEIDAGQRPGTSREESAEMRRLRAEVRELRRANEILRAASVFFAAELDRPRRFS